MHRFVDHVLFNHMRALKAGQKSPSFSLEDQDGNTHTLEMYRGRTVLLYFYPRDSTPGCTREACGFRNAFSKFKSKKAVVLGVSVDSADSHKKFAGAYRLPFPLLADVDKNLVKACGVWAKKKFMGREYMGTLRKSFLIGPDGKIKKIYDKVDPDAHPAEVLADLAVKTSATLEL